ncbi:MAG: enoyl-CoA hydratase-related protein [Betaproteobacteria bacterium]
MDSPPIAITRVDGVGTLTLARPAALNALDFAMMDALVDATCEFADDDSLRVVVIRGEGRHFMAGGDIRAFAGELGRDADARRELFTRVVDGVNAAIENLVRMPHPVVARLQGAVAGFGMSLMNAADIVIAADDAFFAAGYRNIALSPDGGGTYTLPRLVGHRRAAEILLLAERFDAARALELGLVNRVVPLADLDVEVDKVVGALRAAPVHAVRATKRLLRDSPQRSLSEQLHAEALAFGQCSAQDDFVEGIGAFIAKRTPAFDR